MPDPGRAASEAVIAADRLGRAITETRRILAALRPLAVDAGGLAEAARQSLDEVARDTGWSVALVENLGQARLPPAIDKTAWLSSRFAGPPTPPPGGLQCRRQAAQGTPLHLGIHGDLCAGIHDGPSCHHLIRAPRLPGLSSAADTGLAHRRASTMTSGGALAQA